MQIYLDLVDIHTTVDINHEEGDQLFQWVQLAHIDDEGNFDSKIVVMARGYGFDVNEVFQQEITGNANG